jgi:hypothetical protein
MSEFDDLIADLKQKRDELRLKIHLASKEAQDEWDELEEKMQEFSSRAELDKTGEGLGDAFAKLGEELKLGYKRIRNAVTAGTVYRRLAGAIVAANSLIEGKAKCFHTEHVARCCAWFPCRLSVWGSPRRRLQA